LFPALKLQYDLHERYLAGGDYLAVSNCLGYGALLAREKLGIRLITAHLQPVVIQSRSEPPYIGGMVGPRFLRYWAFRLGGKFIIDRTVCPSLNAWRRELSLPPVRNICQWWHSPDGVLCMFPSWFAAPQNDWPQPMFQTDFPLWNDGSRNEASQSELPQSVLEFLADGDKPIVFAPGSMNLYGARFFAQAATACMAMKRRAILLTEFPEQLPANLPASMAHFSYVPLDLLLRHAALIVHHGGVGTTSQAMLAGIPQIAVPMAHDQFDNAARLIRLGIGRAIPAAHFTASRLTRAVDELLTAPEVVDRCRSCAERLTPRNGLSLSVSALTR
jgi:UDP:flavonoid glycosyltransferase YjiC (YdhE family)